MINKFKFWCHKVLPLVYDDSLSYYELLCKVVHKLNEVIDNENKLSEGFKNVQEIVNQTVERVDEYTELVEQTVERVDEYTELVERLSDDIAELTARVVTTEGNVTQLTGDVTQLQGDERRLSTDVAVLKDDVSNIDTLVRGIQNVLGDDTSGLVADVAQLKNKMTEAESDITSLEERTANLENAVNVGIPYEFASLQNWLTNVETKVNEVDGETAALDDRVTAIEGSLGKMYRHMVRVRFRNVNYQTTAELGDTGDLIDGTLSGVLYLNVFNDNDSKLQSFASLSSALQADGGVLATGYVKFDNANTADLLNYPLLNYKGEVLRVRRVPNESALNIDFSFENAVLYSDSTVPNTPIEYVNNVCSSVSVRTLKLDATTGVTDFYDVREELPANLFGGGSAPAGKVYMHNLGVNLFADCRWNNGAYTVDGQISGRIYTQIFSDSSAPITSLAELLGLIGENGIAVTGGCVADNIRNVELQNYQPLHWNLVPTTIKNNGYLQLEFLPIFSYVEGSDNPSDPAEYQYKACTTGIQSTTIPSFYTFDVTDNVQELAANGGDVQTQKYRHDFCFKAVQGNEEWRFYVHIITDESGYYTRNGMPTGTYYGMIQYGSTRDYAIPDEIYGMCKIDSGADNMSIGTPGASTRYRTILKSNISNFINFDFETITAI